MTNLSTNLLDDSEDSLTPSTNLMDGFSPDTGELSNAPVMPKPVPVAPAPVTMREFGDINSVRKNIYDSVLKATAEMKPMSNKTHTLRVRDVQYIDPDKFSLAAQKKAVLSGSSLGRRMAGVWELLDNATGSVLDSRKQVLGTVPHYTDRGTFINNGTEYALRNQQRLRSGVFTRIKDNGEIESHANFLPGKGVSHRYHLEPEKSILFMTLGPAKMPLLPLMTAMGATPDQLKEAWGEKIYNANYSQNTGAALSKLATKFLPVKDRPTEPTEIRQALAAKFQSMELDPEVTKRTIGREQTHMTLDTLLDTTKKLIGVSKGEIEPDDRDALPYQRILGPEDLFSERIDRDYGAFRKQLLWKMTNKGNLSNMPSSALKKQIDSTLLQSGLGNAMEEINPAEILDKHYAISRMGEGGIENDDAIPDDSRSVQSSHFGYMDALRTPESGRAGVDLYMSSGTRKGSDGKLYSSFRDKTGNMVWKTPQDAADLVVGFPGSFNSRDEHVPVFAKGKESWAKRDEVDIELPRFEQAFSPLANLVPLMSMVKGQRVSMASRMITQALPLVGGEAPLVQAAVPGTNSSRSYEQEYASKMGAKRAERSGRVMSISPDTIKVRYDDNTEEDVELYNNMPFNRKSVTGDTTIYVKRNGKIIVTAISNYSWLDGDLTLSVNPKTKRSAWSRINGYIKHENDKILYRVTTVSGRSVVVTEDHSLITLGSDGEMTPVYPEDCVEGRTRMPVALIPVKTGRKRIVANVNDVNSGRLVGLYLSEGHCTPNQPGLISISVKPSSRASQVLSLLWRMGYSAYRSSGSVDFTDHDKCQYLVENFGHLAHNKCIPSWILNSSLEFRIGLIEGYMGGDGNLWIDSNGAIQVTGVSVSKRLRDGLVDVLASLGIFTTLFDAPRAATNENWRDGFGFRVMSSHLNRLSSWFFYTDREAKLRKSLKSIYRSSPFEAIPVPNALARKCLYNGLAKVPTYIHKTAVQGAVAKHRLVNATGVYGDWGRSDVMWDIVKTIEIAPYEKWVYDLSVDKSEVFAVDAGLIVHNTTIHQTPMVRVGDTFDKDALLAKSNFTDDTGTTALGRNLRTAYIPWQGKNFEDAVVISRSAAENKLASEHMYQHGIDKDDKTKIGFKEFVGMFPAKFDRQTLDKIDRNGIIRPGETVKYGDPLVLAIRQNETSYNKVHKQGQAGYGDATVTWDHHDDGVVTDVVEGKKGPVVIVKATSKMQVGDKLSGRYGDKGVVADIIDDEQMPHDKDGNPFEILLSPLGVTTRTNPAQKVELALGKLAAHNGKPEIIEDWQDADYGQQTRERLGRAGLSLLDDIYDPVRNRKIKQIHTGNRFFMKLHHSAEGKVQGRGGGGYSSEDAPTKGSGPGGGSKRNSLLDTNALLSHGAVENLQDIGAVRGQRNEEFWMQFMQGHTPQVKSVPTAYKKFVAQLQASGINVTRSGTQTNIMALTDKDIDGMAGDRNIDSSDGVDWKNQLKPIKGGLFDPQLTGGHGSDRWSAIKLTEPMPNPVMEEPIRRVLGLTKQQFEDTIAGKHELPGTGTGPTAIAKALKAIDLDASIASAREGLQANNASEKDKAIRKLGYLKSAKRMGLHPSDWVLNRAPVLPTTFRPVTMMTNEMPLVSDANYLYKELIEANKGLASMKGVLEDSALGDERLAVYHAFKGVTGLGDPTTQKNKDKNVKGILKSVFGSAPKFGTVQRKLLSNTVDNVGRAVVTPNPDMDMDSIGIPEDKAFDVYSKFLVRRFRRQGLSVLGAMQQIKDRSKLARQMLVEEMDERPVYANRAPVLHKFGILAFRPVLVKGNTLQASPLIVKGFNLDFDGDTMNFHVPTSNAANKEAIDKMLPSRSLISPRDFKSTVHAPGQDYVGGLFFATGEKSKKAKKYFHSLADARKAHERGEIDMNDEIEILD